MKSIINIIFAVSLCFVSVILASVAGCNANNKYNMAEKKGAANMCDIEFNVAERVWPYPLYSEAKKYPNSEMTEIVEKPSVIVKISIIKSACPITPSEGMFFGVVENLDEAPLVVGETYTAKVLNSMMARLALPIAPKGCGPAVNARYLFELQQVSREQPKGSIRVLQQSIETQ